MHEKFMEHYWVDCQHRGVAKAQAFMAKCSLEILLEDEKFQTMPQYLQRHVTESVERLEDIERMLKAVGAHSKHLTCSDCGSPRSHLDAAICCPNDCGRAAA